MNAAGAGEDSLSGERNTNKRPLYGHRLLPRLLDEISKTTPYRLYASYPYSVDISLGFRDVTFQDMARATDSFAWWIHDRYGRSNEFESLAYMGVPDLRTPIIFLAAVKCGYKLLLLSQRNAIPTNVSLLEQTRCSKFLHSSEMEPIIKDVKKTMENLKSVEVPSLEEMFEGKSQQYQYDEVFERAERNPVVILHSSGSTGIPKPITMTHGTFATIDNDRNMPVVEGRRNADATIWDFMGDGRFYSPFPPSHLAGFVATAVRPIYSEASAPVLGPALRPATGTMLKEILQHQKLQGLYLPPTIAEQLLQEPGGLDNFRGSEFLCYAGGPLATAAGDQISKVIDVCTTYGGTETGQIHQLFPSRDDWGYMEWHPAEDLTMEPAEDDAYELVMHVSLRTEGMSHLNHNFPGMIQYRTRDLFRPHPSKPNLWRFHGRRDDIIVLSNGEKFNPVPMESLVQGDPKVSGALVVGQGRFQAALLIEPKAGVTDKAALKTSIWPLVQKGNSQLPSQGRISLSKVFISDSNKPFQRAGKGTVIRKLTESDFATEVEDLYNANGQGAQTIGPILKATYNHGSVKDFIRALITEYFSGLEIRDSDDLYVLGLDSLKTIEIANSLRAGLKSQAASGDLSWISNSVIYANSSIDQLATVIAEFLNSGLVPDQKSNAANRDRVEKMSALVETYTTSLPQTILPQKKRGVAARIIALTGSTGSLGFHLLQKLTEDPTISKVYCLDRAADAQQRNEQNFNRRGSTHQLQKVTYFTVKLAQRNLGLTPVEVAELKENVDLIIHNAWKVDFNAPLESFEDVHIRGTRNIIDWCASSERQPRIIFISSVSSVNNWAEVYGDAVPVPEKLLENYEIASTMGYGESKNVAERILGIASQQTHIPVSVFRLGQVAGSTRSEDFSWPEQEWVPSLIKTSKSLGLIPRDLPPVDWIPINHLAEIILELAYSDSKSEENEKVYNLVNPRPAPWVSLLNTIRGHLGPSIVNVPFTTWLTALEGMQGLQDVSLIPALKLLGFFRELEMERKTVRFEMKRVLKTSKSLAQIEPVNSGWMGIWLEQWNF